ncbi:plasmid stabilization system [Ancylobacter novellus DSM 506]|uniref:Plasmid stabilization system n=1 Tax=Ancylobacter novellus (strain ATCC 8093 / DSM 506 / JCM 20403 / CCM 1077 / IAM 12100 / NBRC 12443 / NCIMB 10456) TaxID=639283 RepID=D7A5H5_ANCN5|nr:type II toxin-antitoxin system RelE/ParE family toxin [Ancylobacter novellus]ADH88099.1 plasmid stabilization system [Ancylobacter novellus DSM 506]
MTYRIIFSPEAEEDLIGIYRFVSQRSGRDLALGYVQRIEAYCRGFATFPKRGTCRDDLAPNTRLVGFERRVMIAFHIDGDLVVFDRILYGGRSLDRLSDDED